MPCWPWSAGKRLRVGIIGCVTLNALTPPTLLQAFPAEHDLYLYEVPYQDYASFQGLADGPCTLRTVHLDTPESIDAACRMIEQDHIDVLLVAHPDHEQRLRLFSRATTPCLVMLCTGSYPSFHSKASFALYCQPRVDCRMEGHSLFSAYTGKAIPSEPCVHQPPFCDATGLGTTANTPWRERSPYMFFHGRLRKLADSPLLCLLWDLLDADPDLTFGFAGQGQEDAERILASAAARGHSLRVSYLGVFEQPFGRASSGWQELERNLQRARLAPNPWPIGGAMSRMEAYLCGTPTVHLGMRDDLSPFDVTDQTLIDIPSLAVPTGTARTLEEYAQLCRRCLYDETFADELTRQQLQTAEQLTNGQRWWRIFFNHIQEWRRGL